MEDLKQRFGWLRRRKAEMSDEDEFIDHPHELENIGELVREGSRVQLRRHVPENRRAFQRWYADEEIARLLRHDQRPLNHIQSRGYFDTLILPSSARGLCYAIHEASTERLIGTTALTDFEGSVRRTAYFRIVIGEKDCWGKGYGTEATDLVMQEAFYVHGLNVVKLEVFKHNERAARAYLRVGFTQTGEHIEWIGRERWELHVLEMELERDVFLEGQRQGMTPFEDDPLAPEHS